MFSFNVYNPSIYAASKLTLLRLIRQVVADEKRFKHNNEGQISEVLAYIYAFEWLEAHQDHFKLFRKQGSLNIHEVGDIHNIDKIARDLKYPAVKNAKALDYLNLWLEQKGYKQDLLPPPLQAFQEQLDEDARYAFEEAGICTVISRTALVTLISVAIVTALVATKLVNPVLFFGCVGVGLLGMILGTQRMKTEGFIENVEAHACAGGTTATNKLLAQTFPLQTSKKQQPIAFNPHGDAVQAAAEGAKKLR